MNFLSSKSGRVMHFFWVFMLHCLHCNIVFQAWYVPGIDNVVADALSQQQIDRFRVLVPVSQPDFLPVEVWSFGGLKPIGP